MKTHRLKCWLQYYKDICSGKKTFEYRKNDRNYKVGDKVVLCEYDYAKSEYTGAEISFFIDYIIYGTNDDKIGIPFGYCIFSVPNFDVLEPYSQVELPETNDDLPF